MKQRRRFLPSLVWIVTLQFLAAALGADESLHDAVKSGDLETVRTLAGEEAARLELDRSGRSPFHLAVMEDDLELVQAVYHPELVNRPDSMRLSPLYLASGFGTPEVVSYLIERGADLGSQNGGARESCLHWAVERGKSENVRVLIEAGADLEAPNGVGSTPLLVAAKFGDAERARLLLAAGARLEAANAAGVTPLLLAARSGNLETVAALLEAGANVGHVAFLEGWTALHLAAKSDHVPIVKLLLEHGADPAAKLKDGRTPLDLALEFEAEASAARLRESAASKKRPDSRARTTEGQAPGHPATQALNPGKASARPLGRRPDRWTT